MRVKLWLKRGLQGGILLLGLSYIPVLDRLADLLARTYVQRHNPYILADLGKAPWPREQPAAPPVKLALHDAAIAWATTAINEPVADEWEVPRKDETPDQATARRALFPNLDEEQRSMFAICHAETVMRFDSRGVLLNVYSDWFKRLNILDGKDSLLPAADIRATAKQAAHSGQTVTVTLPLDLPGNPDCKTDFHFLPVRETGEVYVFAGLEYAYLRAQVCNIPQDSRWDVNALRYKRNLRSPSPLTSNRYGFRAPDVTVPKPGNVFRILCIGGSTTHEGSDNPSTYPALLQERLKSLFPGRQIEVLNCGIEGIRTRSQFLLLADYLELTPDLIVAYEGINDVANEIQDVWEDTRPFPYDVLKCAPFVGYYLRPLLWPTEKTFHGWIKDLTIANFECLRRVCACKGIRLALCSNAYPNYDELPRDQRQFYSTKWWRDGRVYSKLLQALNAEIKQYCARKHLLYIPVNENITSTIDYLLDFCHMRPNGIALKADIVTQSIKDYIAPAVNALK